MAVETPILVTFIAYLALMILLGLYAYKATNNHSDYILGGRSLSPSVAALSVGASDMSGWLLLGLPGAIYTSGASEVWIGVGLVVGAAINWVIAAKRLRIYTELANNSQTLPEFLSNRFNDQAGYLKTVSAIAILVFFTFYTASGLVAGAFLFEEVFGFDYTMALLIGTLIIVSYTFVGGFFAVSWTDFFQGILMLIALLLVPCTIYFELGGSDAISQTIPPELLSFAPTAGIIALVSSLAWGLGYFGQPHILVRFMAIRSADDVATSRNIAMSWMTLSLCGALATGLIGAAYFAAEPLNNPETVFIFLSKVAFNPWIAGLLIAAILSAVMSTVDSQLLVSSSVISEDLYRQFIRPKATDKELMMVGRIAVVSIAALALIIAQDPKSSVLGLVGYAWAGFGAAFGPLVILSLYWKDYNKFGAIASIVTGTLVVIIWPELKELGGLFALYEIIPGFILAAIAGVGVSKATGGSCDNVKQQFEAFSQKL
ncbi:sodium/proline symporter PutP [Psychrobium sp. 1_MG-2023]|uniref:sodium/proline symporter PutP n=1 Tax=Psychrobium sp. 1_MG-2023 TaxID=3062624 RepID=UPI000C322920|nr:sodium/proline symporter PutP [Psychrobium sp. 1_MG-2023]MDP2561742.1 sodium/proline symporter PutP [Psychrobium sp. 1_MG-2023]PKF59769.1 sodium/proline symporter PutP [Alteromonadales bacterium alter-6D02]